MTSTEARSSTGVDGLDEILHGGLLPRTSTLLRGPPGAGKTTFGLHFLTAGVERDETVLYINLGEPAAYLRRATDRVGPGADGISFLELGPAERDFDEAASYSLFSAAEVEQTPIVEEIRSSVTELAPDRVLLDPITQFRYLAGDEYQFRKQVLSFLDFLRAADATVFLTSQTAGSMPDDDLQFLTDAVLTLHRNEDWRAVEVSKFRGSDFVRGQHAYEIDAAGIEVFPRLQPATMTTEFTGSLLPSGVTALDEMLHGGIDVGTVTYLTGPTGVGKTTLGVQFLKAAAEEGRSSVMFAFEEAPSTVIHRAESIDIPITEMLERGTLAIEELAPKEMTVDAFTHRLRRAVEDDGAELVMIDGITGFRQGLRGLEGDPTRDLVAIGRYLRNHGVTALFANEVHDITGRFKTTEEHSSNLADTVIFLRHVEFKGKMRKVIGVLKKRASDFQPELRELEITEDGLTVGNQLSQLRGIVTGTPEWTKDEVDQSRVETD